MDDTYTNNAAWVNHLQSVSDWRLQDDHHGVIGHGRSVHLHCIHMCDLRIGAKPSQPKDGKPCTDGLAPRWTDDIKCGRSNGETCGGKSRSPPAG